MQGPGLGKTLDKPQSTTGRILRVNQCLLPNPNMFIGRTPFAKSKCMIQHAQAVNLCGLTLIEWTFLLILKMATMTSPKLKAEFAGAISAMTGLSKEKLMEHSMERLKEAWSVIKPVKTRVLPANWRKFDLQSLKELYVDTILPYYRREDDGHWVRMKRAQLITKMELYMADRSMGIQEKGDERAEAGMPTCPGCGVVMMVRNNRVTKEPLLGCRLFPTCRHTLPITALHKEAEEVPVPSTPPARVTKQKRGGEPESDGSWKIMEQDKLEQRTVNTNLTEAEVVMLQNFRASQSS